jgi:hypothetical protein
MSQKITLVTTSRQDMVDITHTLAKALDLQLMTDPKAPIVMSLNGSMESGKAIFSDEMHHALFNKKFTSDRAQFVVDEIGGQKVEFDYIDIAFNNYQSSVEGLGKGSYADREKAFFAERQEGGISVVQNIQDLGKAGLGIWVEKNKGYQMYESQLGAEHGSRFLGNALADVFQHAAQLYPDKAQDRSWVRYVEIDIRDQRLLDSPKFQEAVKFLTKASAEVAVQIKGEEPTGFKPLPPDDPRKVRLESLKNRPKYKM